MIEIIFHVFGICPDSFSHIDLLDIVIANYQQIVDFINRKI